MEKFKPSKINTEKVVISIRIDINTLEEIDKEAAKIEISRNELITQCIDFALSNIDKKDKA
jgi:metal-responsive CopG/Arc/MetJ family transcriptional regulator